MVSPIVPDAFARAWQRCSGDVGYATSSIPGEKFCLDSGLEE
ncbi:hypothetical protein [Frankia sp. Cr1]|nr:hypothetical protein [Frankia sp. Cr1]